MTIHRHFLIIVGRFKFENWHLYRHVDKQSKSGKAQWWTWERVL